MKNASLLYLCCIFVLITFPISLVYLNYDKSEDSQNDSFNIKVFDNNNMSVTEMPFEEYVWRVAAVEMPVSFHDDAIMAQMVAARTYAIRKIIAKSHGNDADVCTDYNHCTAFLTQGDEKHRFGNKQKYYCDQLRNLALRTKDQILTYEGKPILAVFHATSSGITEKSSDVWKTQLPYLINVDSSADIYVKGFNSTNFFTEDELKKALNISSEPIFSIISHTSAGSVKRIKVNNQEYTGEEIRKILKLKSSNFSIKKDGATYIFNVKGYGHGVGLSQTGANEYANKGLNYKEILMKYYPGTVIEKLNDLDLDLNTTKKSQK